MQQASTQISRHTLQITQRITKVKTKKQLNMCYPSCISKRKIMLTWLEFNIIRAILQKTSFEEQYWPCLIGRNNNYAVWRKGCVALKAVSPLPRVCVCVCPPLFVEFLPTCSIRTEESHSEWIHETCCQTSVWLFLCLLGSKNTPVTGPRLWKWAPLNLNKKKKHNAWLQTWESHR